MVEVNLCSLSELKPGTRGKVSRIACKGQLRRRMFDMGLTPGVEVTLKGMAPMGDPIEVLVRGYSLSLRKKEAEDILIEKI